MPAGHTQPPAPHLCHCLLQGCAAAAHVAAAHTRVAVGASRARCTDLHTQNQRSASARSRCIAEQVSSSELESTSSMSNKRSAAEHRMRVGALEGECADAGRAAAFEACSRLARGKPSHCLAAAHCKLNVRVQGPQVCQGQLPQAAQAHGCGSHASRSSASLSMAAA